MSLLSLLSVILVLTASAQGRPASRMVEVWVVQPANAQTTISSEQAVSAVHIWMAEINAWFQRDLGQSFGYTVTVIQAGVGNGPTDACGSWQNAGVPITNLGIGLSAQDRSIIVMLGAGGWAGHFSPADRGVDHYGMVGDWGVMEQFDLRNACVPDWDYPNRGFSHEFMGMMGAYVTAGYNEGGLFVGDPMSANIKKDLLRYSGKWLRSP